MATFTSILRVLSDFGDAAGWLIAAIVLVAFGRRILRENEKAHTAIGENIKESRRALEGKIDENRRALEGKIDENRKQIDGNREQLDQNRREITSRLDRVMEMLANK